MKNKLINGLESIVKGIGNSVKKARKNILTTAAAVALPFMFNTNAYASTGMLEIDNKIDSPYTNSRILIWHGTDDDISEGLDKYDSHYIPMYNPSGVASQIYTMVEDTAIDIDVRPENSTSSVPFDLGLAFESGSGQISSSNYLSISYTGFDGEDVTITINGTDYDAKTTSTIPLPNLVNQGAGNYLSGTVSFSTPQPVINLATLDTEQPINVTPTGATFSFEVSDDGYSAGDESWTAGFFYKPSSASEWMQTEEFEGSGEGTFQQTVTGLSENTTYDVMAYLINSAGTAYGDTETATTTYTINTPTVSTRDARNITKDSAGLVGLLSDDGDPTTTSAQTSFVYYMNGGSQLVTPWQTTTEGAEFSSDISGLDPNTVYMFYARAKNSEKTGTGSTKTFETLKASDAPIDPNSSPVTINPDLPTIIIQNRVDQLETDPNKPHKNQGNWTYIEFSGNSEKIDANDVGVSESSGLQSEIYSTVMEFTPDANDPNTTIIYAYDLSTQANPENPEKDMLITLSLTGDPNDSINSSNYLRFWANDPNSEDPNQITTSFAGPLTLQQFDPNMLNIGGEDPNAIWDVYDPNVFHVTNTKYPVRDLKKYINKKQDIPLDNITTSNVDPNEIADPNSTKTIEMNKPYTHFSISRTGEVADINGDGKVDANDSDAFEPYLWTGPSRGDIYSTEHREIGMTDDLTGLEDGQAVEEEIFRHNPSQPINARYGLKEDFEDNKFNNWIKNDPNNPWVIDDKYYASGNFSAHAELPSGTQGTSSLELNISIDSPSTLKFKRKIRAGYGEDWGELYLNDIRIKRWTGERNWAEESVELEPGDYNIRFDLKNTNGGLIGDQGFWLDDLQVIPNEYLAAKAIK